MSPEQLFPCASRDFLTQLAGLPKHLDAAMPMRRQHRRELPGDIRHLSHLLTDERGDLRRDYLADPAALSAYLRYFLPWNIYRLGVLFAGLALDPGGDDPNGAATIIDLGTGPLTAPLALWLSRPRLRRRPLTFICVDRAPKPMRLGLDVLHSLAASQGGIAPWKITLVKGPLDARLRERADLLIMANALNEVLHRGESEDLLETADALAWHLSSMLTPTGALCVVEPGVRPSAHLMAALRRGFLHHGLKPLAPCPHTEPCPMSGRGYTAWCHFNFDAEAAPGWLKKLSDEARLTKDNVSLSFLHFSAKGRKLEAAPGKSLVRAVSGPFELPAPDGMAPRRFGQYCCSERGLTLLSLPKKHLVPLPGALLEAAWPDYPETDAKSHALILPLGGDVPTPAMRPAPDMRSEHKPAPKGRPSQFDEHAHDSANARDGKPSATRGDKHAGQYDAPRAPQRPRSARSENSGQPEGFGQPGKLRQSSQSNQSGHSENSGQPERAPRPERSARPTQPDTFSKPYQSAAPAQPKQGQSGKSAKPLTVDSIIAAGKPGEAGTPAAPPKRKRLPSERPADPVKAPRGSKTPGQSTTGQSTTGKSTAGRPAGSGPAQGKAEPKSKDKPHASRAQRKAAGGEAAGKKPGAAPGTGAAPGKRSGGNAGGEAGDRIPGNTPGNAPGNASGNTPGNASGNTPGNASGGTTGPKSGQKPSTKPGKKPSKKPSKKADRKPGKKSGGKAGAKPGAPKGKA